MHILSGAIFFMEIASHLPMKKAPHAGATPTQGAFESAVYCELSDKVVETL